MRHLYYLFTCLLLWPIIADAQRSIDQIPNPKLRGQQYFISNPDGIISSPAEKKLNASAARIEKESSVEICVVVVEDYALEDDFEFALNLFDTWGIGKSDNDNGLLLLVATQRRQYRFITGYGVEAVLPDALLKQLGERLLIPAFKAGNYDEGLQSTMDLLSRILADPVNLDEVKADLTDKDPYFLDRNFGHLQRWCLISLFYFLMYLWLNRISGEVLSRKNRKRNLLSMLTPMIFGSLTTAFILFIGIFVVWLFAGSPEPMFQMSLLPWYAVLWGMNVLSIKYVSEWNSILKSFRDDENRLNALLQYNRKGMIPAIFSLFSIAYLLRIKAYSREMAVRLSPPDETGNWKRINIDLQKGKTDKKYLNDGQRSEERLLSRSYQIWIHKISGEVSIQAWDGRQAKAFDACPECGFRTLNGADIKVLKTATYTREGIGEKTRKCKHCLHELSLGSVVIAKKSRSSSSSGSGSGGSSRSSGSFGGGRSGGGGAGGSW